MPFSQYPGPYLLPATAEEGAACPLPSSPIRALELMYYCFEIFLKDPSLSYRYWVGSRVDGFLSFCLFPCLLVCLQ